MPLSRILDSLPRRQLTLKTSLAEHFASDRIRDLHAGDLAKRKNNLPGPDGIRRRPFEQHRIGCSEEAAKRDLFGKSRHDDAALRQLRRPFLKELGPNGRIVHVRSSGKRNFDLLPNVAQAEGGRAFYAKRIHWIVSDNCLNDTVDFQR